MRLRAKILKVIVQRYDFAEKGFEVVVIDLKEDVFQLCRRDADGMEKVKADIPDGTALDFLLRRWNNGLDLEDQEAAVSLSVGSVEEPDGKTLFEFLGRWRQDAGDDVVEARVAFL